MARGLVIAAPRSGSGKTTLTLALLRALRRRGLAVGSAKIGPDFIDPRFHEAATGAPCLNLDGWAMRPELMAGLVAGLAAHDVVLIEGVMGLFDAAEEPGVGSGSTAEIAKALGLPVLLLLDTAGMGQSVAALAQGYAGHDPGLRIAGVVLNGVASERHRRILTGAMEGSGLRLLGCVPRDPRLARPSRHLGLVQAEEGADLEFFLDTAAEIVAAHVDLEALLARTGRIERAGGPLPCSLPPLGQRVAIASDVAFRFAYPHLLEGWRHAGVELSFFSPLGDEAPDGAADAVFLPGGYPELHAGTLAAAGRFAEGMRAAASRGAAIYGECGGYMALGRGLVDAEGARHAMLGLLPLETSYAERALHLGYRHVTLARSGPLGQAGTGFRAHEFHYSRTVSVQGEPLFGGSDGVGFGLRVGPVMGSYLHVIDRSSSSVLSEEAGVAA